MAKRTQKARDPQRKPKKKVSILVQEEVDYVDWKDVNLLRRFMSDRAKVRARRVTGNSAQQQRQVAQAIKNAREMALLPYTSRVTTQRGRPRGDDGDRPRRPRTESSEEFQRIPPPPPPGGESGSPEPAATADTAAEQGEATS